MDVSIRKFMESDIAAKVKWINDPANNQYLHYDLPLEYGKTCFWFEVNKDKKNRYDAVIEVDGKAIGLIGLVSIDDKNKKAEYYICIGEPAYKGKGIALKATMILLGKAFTSLKMEKVYLYTEEGNSAAQNLFQRAGFRREGILKKDLFYRGRFVDRYLYRITREEFYHGGQSSQKIFNFEIATPIQRVRDVCGCRVFVKRDDLIPVSFGGNKARKAFYFFQEIDKGGYDCVVTYGSSSSNHCRVISNMAAMRRLSCYIISPREASEPTFNSRMMEQFGAEITVVPVADVHDSIEEKIQGLTEYGRKPYFIAGGGHGNLGTQSYVDCYEEIRQFERVNQIYFDHIFLASGTGTTQAGLICGQLMEENSRKIVGVSIARKNPRGRQIVVDSVRAYLKEKGFMEAMDQAERVTFFDDNYTGEGYGWSNGEIRKNIRDVLFNDGIPLDATYTGKAYAGMKAYMKEHCVREKDILFLHTGGIPLFFDDLAKGVW